ncbi:hypothetical protein [Moraxella catarrhalis]|uniref:Uncharacterized protein n=1 Tax=Moraxella catarrhalis TaxID=480 RepID=A0A7Z0V013_MORCA|nr:hypothetical protein [Moraxella catarrhalis]OAV01660.1 hypothetical protein AO382_0026 [Moraxella catarrhalis]
MFATVVVADEVGFVAVGFVKDGVVYADDAIKWVDVCYCLVVEVTELNCILR